MTCLTKEELEAIRKRAEAATPGPWFWIDDGRLYSDGADKVIGEVIEGKDETWFDLFDTNAEFIAHAREDIPKLLAEIEWLERELQNEVRKKNEIAKDWSKIFDERYKALEKIKRYKESLENIEMLEFANLSDEEKFDVALHHVKIALEGDTDDNEV